MLVAMQKTVSSVDTHAHTYISESIVCFYCLQLWGFILLFLVIDMYFFILVILNYISYCLHCRC